MPDKAKNVIDYFSAQVKEILGDGLTKVILYGSYARGDYRDNSDMDVMILVNMPDSEIKKIRPAIYDLAFEIELEKNIHISVVIKNEAQFAYWVDTLPFYKNVRREGIEISAK